MHLHEDQWESFIVEQIESKWNENFDNKMEDRKKFEWNEKCFYKFRRRDESITTMSFNEVEVKFKADQIRPLVSNGASLEPIWCDDQWEKTSPVPNELRDETKTTLMTYITNFHASSAFVTVQA